MQISNIQAIFLQMYAHQAYAVAGFMWKRTSSEYNDVESTVRSENPLIQGEELLLQKIYSLLKLCPDLQTVKSVVTKD